MSIIYKISKYLFLIPFNILWYLQLLIPRNKNTWIFGSWYGEKYSDNSRALFEYVHDNHKDIHPIWFTKNRKIKEHLNNEGKSCEISNSLKGIFFSLKAGYVIFSSGTNDVNPFFIKGAKIVNTWHGAPMKKIGYDDKYTVNKVKNLLFSIIYPFLRDEPDKIITTSEVFNSNLSSAFKIPVDRIVCTGYPRNDIFYSTQVHPLTTQWNEKFGNPIKIIYLPTFRSLKRKFHPFEGYNFNEQNWNNFLEKNNYILISKGHFVDKEIGDKSGSARIIHLSDESVDDVNFLLKDMDMLITDYSGAYFDYLLTEKPIIFAPFDYEDYVSKDRELYFEYEDVICGPIARNWNEVMNSISRILENDTYHHRRIEMNCKFNKHHDNLSSLRMYQFIKSFI